MGKWHTTEVSDGTEMQLYIANDNILKKPPGLILCHEVYGVNSYMKNLAHKISELGFVVAVPEFYHRTAGNNFEGSEINEAVCFEHMNMLKEEEIARDQIAAYDWLLYEIMSDNIGSLGFCLGGKLAFIANAILPLKCAVIILCRNHLPNLKNPKPTRPAFNVLGRQR